MRAASCRRRVMPVMSTSRISRLRSRLCLSFKASRAPLIRAHRFALRNEPGADIAHRRCQSLIALRPQFFDARKEGLRGCPPRAGPFLFLSRELFFERPVLCAFVFLELRPDGGLGIPGARRTLQIEIDDVHVEFPPRTPVIDRGIIDHPAATIDAPARARTPDVALDMLRVRPFMNAGLAPDPLRLQRSAVDPRVNAGTRERFVADRLPPLANPHDRLRSRQPRLAAIAGAVGQAQHAAACLDIAIMDCDMDMRIVRVLADLVDRREPRDELAACQVGHERFDQLCPLMLVQFRRQCDPQLVQDAAVLAHGAFGPVDPGSRRVRLIGHVLGEQHRVRIRPTDIADTRARGAGGMCRAPDAFQVAAIDRHGRSPAIRTCRII